MRDCTYFLYKALLKRFPYVTSPDTEYAAEKLKATKDQPSHDMLELLDCVEALADDRASYAFQLGLDVGLSIAQESRQLQSEL